MSSTGYTNENRRANKKAYAAAAEAAAAQAAQPAQTPAGASNSKPCAYCEVQHAPAAGSGKTQRKNRKSNRRRKNRSRKNRSRR